MKRAVRRAVVHLLYALGVLQLLARIAFRRRAVVLMYHRVLPPEALDRTWSHPGIIVLNTTFERQLKLLRRHFRLLTADQFQACLERNRFEPRSCLVTFDDGWIDTYAEAWPALQRHGVPALVFLPSAYIGTGEVFWQERLGRILYAIRQRARDDDAFARAARAALEEHGLQAALDLDGEALRPQILDLTRQLKVNGARDPDRIVDALQPLVPDTAGAGERVDRFIDWSQAREMARDGVTFGAHGETHRRLTRLPIGEVRREVEACREALRRGLGTDAAAFCYPNGDWNAEVAGAVADGRFQLAFSTARGHVAPGADRFALRRVNVHEDMTASAPMFLARLLGVI